MFNNIGEKIKKLATVICWIGIILFIILGAIVIANGKDSGKEASLLVGLLVMIVGSLISWVGSFFTYGFGELISKVTKIEERMHGISPMAKNKSPNLDRSKNTGIDQQILAASGDWKSEVESLKDEELLERYNNDYEWTSEYRELCYRELMRRKSKQEEKGKWFCPECARENSVNISVCKCGHQKD